MSSKSDKAKLAEGAAKIKKAEAEQKQLVKVEPLLLQPLKQSMNEIVRERVTVLPGNIGLKLAENTTLEESLVILDWTTTMSDHVGFMIGDALNFGNTKWGEKYTQALNQTGRAKPTLKEYASVCARIPFAQRQASLNYTHHREIVRIGDAEKVATVLKQVGEEAEKGNIPTTREVALKVRKLTPRKKKVKKATSGKGKRKVVRELPPYEPTAEEQSRLDQAEEALNEARQSIKSEGGIYKIVAKMDNKEKRRWTDLCIDIVTFYNAIDKITGY
jgi:hypothetical protein